MPTGQDANSTPSGTARPQLAGPSSPIAIKPPRHPASPAPLSSKSTTPGVPLGNGISAGGSFGVEKSSYSESRLIMPAGGLGPLQRASAQGTSPPSRTPVLSSLARTSYEHHGYHRPVDIGTHTLPGTRYAGLNQDYLVVQALYTPGEIPRGGQQTYVLAVCDGHGILGDKSACFAGKALARHVYSSNLRNKHLSRLHCGEVQAEMKAAFKKAHHSANLVYDMPPKTVQYPHTPGASKLTAYNLVDAAGIKTYRNEKGSEKMLECGTTCTAAIVQGRCVCLANVGDSHAVVGRETPRDPTLPRPALLGGDRPTEAQDELVGRVNSEVVTVRHYGNLVPERERIEREHSKTTKVLEDGYIKVLEGPYAGYELAVTRALGHKNMEALGVLDDPHVVMLDMDPSHHCCLIMASDGLWDVLEPAQAVHMAMEARAKGQTATQVAHMLVERAVDKGLEGSDEQDNTSAIVVFFNAQVQALATTTSPTTAGSRAETPPLALPVLVGTCSPASADDGAAH